MNNFDIKKPVIAAIFSTLTIGVLSLLTYKTPMDYF